MLALVGIPIRSEYSTSLKKRFNWLASSLFTRKSLAAALRADSVALLRIFDACPGWNPDQIGILDFFEKALQLAGFIAIHPQIPSCCLESRFGCFASNLRCLPWLESRSDRNTRLL